MEAAWSSETLVSKHNVTWLSNPQNHEFNLYRRENFKSHISNHVYGATGRMLVTCINKIYLLWNYNVNNNQGLKNKVTRVYLCTGEQKLTVTIYDNGLFLFLYTAFLKLMLTVSVQLLFFLMSTIELPDEGGQELFKFMGIN